MMNNMANDMNIFNDIMDLEREGKQDESDDLLTIYRLVYIEDGQRRKAEKLQKLFIKKYHYNPKVI